MSAANDINAFVLAASRGELATIRDFLNAGMLVDAANTSGETALYRAVAAGHANVVRTLLDRGAEVNQRDGLGFTPLITAAVFGHADVARALLERGADPNYRASSPLFRGNRTTTALEQARGNRRKEIVELLLQGGAAPGPAEFAYTAVKAFSAAADEPAFQDIQRLVASLCGHEPRRWSKRKGVFSFFLKHWEPLAARYVSEAALPPADSVGQHTYRRRLIDLLQADVRAAGYCLVLSDSLGQGGAARLRLFPTREKFAVLAASGTNGINAGHTTRNVIDWLLALDKENPFILTECRFDMLAGKFPDPIQNSGAWAEKMVEFCPDLSTAPDALAKELERHQTFGFWWG